jgi:putative ABC transport system permease protein
VPTSFIEIKFAIRRLLRRPAISLVAIFSLSLGISATISVLSLLEHIVLHPFPYRNADRIVELTYREKLEIEYTPAILREQIQQLRQAQSIEELVEMDERPEAETTSGIPQDVDVLFLSGNAFEFFGVPALLGRTFLPSDAPDNRTPQPVVVFSYQYWQKRFNRNPEVVGQTFRLGGRAYTILGIMPRTFTWWDCDVYVPLDESDPSAKSFMTVLRIRNGFTKRQAAAEILPIFEQMRREHPSLEQTAVDLNSINDRFKRSLGRALYLILAAVILLLGIGCLNVSILLLAHGASRQQEFALRMALGATVGKIARQSLTEATLISLFGTLIGLVISWRTLPIVTAFLPWQLFPNGLHVPLDARVFLLSAALALSTCLAIALLPAFQAARTDLRQLLHSGLQVAGPTIWMQVTYLILVSIQIALSIVLVTTTATAIDNYRALLAVPLGYDPDHLADFSIPIHVNSYDVSEKRATYLRQLRDGVSEIPGVISSSLGVIGPPYSDWDFKVEVLGQVGQELELCNVNFVDAEYFHTLRISLVEGRIWQDAEVNRDDRLAIVNRAFVKRVLRGNDALGRSIRLPDLKSRPPDTLAASESTGWAPIIGVVADARNNGLDEPTKPQIYLPYSVYMIDWIQLFVRSQADPLLVEPTIRRRIAEIDATQQVSSPVVSMRERIAQQPEFAKARLVAALATAFSILALLLAGIGIYSVVSYTVQQQKKQFAIRLALGARRGDIAKHMLGRFTLSILVGMLGGVVLSWSLHRLIAHWIGSTGRVFPQTVISCLLLIGLAYVACAIPIMKAALAQPMHTLREE